MGLLDRIFGRRREPVVLCKVDPELQQAERELKERQKQARLLEQLARDARVLRLGGHDDDL